MDREKDIGPIYNLYADKNEKYDNKNEIYRNNEDRISDIENSITASLISENKKTLLCKNDKDTQIYLNLLKLFLALGLLIVGIYFLVTEYIK